MPDKTVVATSFGLALTSAARLAAYGDAGEYLDGHGEIGSRQTQLAIDDIVAFSISLRRLTTALDLYDYAKTLTVPRLRLQLAVDGNVLPTIVDSVDTWSLINKLVHSVEIQLYQYPDQVLPNLTIVEAYQLSLERAALKFRPVCRVRSDSGQRVLFHVLALCEAGSNLLDKASETAAEHSIFLGSLFEN